MSCSDGIWGFNDIAVRPNHHEPSSLTYDQYCHMHICQYCHLMDKAIWNTFITRSVAVQVRIYIEFCKLAYIESENIFFLVIATGLEYRKTTFHLVGKIVRMNSLIKYVDQHINSKILENPKRVGVHLHCECRYKEAKCLLRSLFWGLPFAIAALLSV